MLIIILLLILGAVMAYISKFNAVLVNVNLGAYIFNDIPLFYVIIGSLLIGLILSYLVYLVDLLFTSWTLRGKENEIKKFKKEVLELTKRIHQLELENEKLKHNHHQEPQDDNAL
ncbi:MAG TPA: hypothetical protein DEP87_02455 [Candidatus Pacebacteria bacterium]|nr:hypothetical protein [Candidatus Paceibacterota bacterium]